MDHHILWKIGRGEVSMWLDNWSGIGALWNFLPQDRKPRDFKLSEILRNGQCHWGGWDLLLPRHVMDHINCMQIILNTEVEDKPVWTATQKGNFTVASTWQLLRQRRNKNWLDRMNWHNKVPFKMNFILWRALTGKIPTGTKLAKMKISTDAKCCCCRNPQEEDIDHFLCAGNFAKDVWAMLCGPMGIPFNNIPLRLLLKNCWTWKADNPIADFVLKCLPSVAVWEMWKSRCRVKYGKEAHNIRKTMSQISFTLAQLVGNRFVKINLKPDWEAITHLMRSNISTKRTIMVKWIKPSISFVKINSDGSCKDGICGGVGMIRDWEGHLIFAYSLKLGVGTSNWAEATALLYGVNWCINNGYEFILAESDSKLLVECVNDLSSTPWRIQKEVKELKESMIDTGFILKHCYRETNKVADKLASLSHVDPQCKLYEVFADLPSEVKGLMTIDKWNMPAFRTFERKEELTWDPPP